MLPVTICCECVAVAAAQVMQQTCLGCSKGLLGCVHCQAAGMAQAACGQLGTCRARQAGREHRAARAPGRRARGEGNRGAM